MTMCSGKKAYSTSAAAGFFANADGMRPYRCPVCGLFHLTSKRVPPREKRPRGKKRAA